MIVALAPEVANHGFGQNVRSSATFELGYSRRFDFTGFTGLFAPARVPQPILDQLTAAFRTVATSAEMMRRLRAIDTVPGYEDPPAFGASVERTLRQWEELAQSLDLYATG